jgi:hypothetical protein
MPINPFYSDSLEQNLLFGHAQHLMSSLVPFGQRERTAMIKLARHVHDQLISYSEALKHNIHEAKSFREAVRLRGCLAKRFAHLD